MSGVLTLERIIAFLKVDLMFACCWPLSTEATRGQRIRDKVFRCLCCANGTLMVIALLYTLSIDYGNMLLVMKVGCELSASVQVPIQITLFTLKSDRLQVRVRAPPFRDFRRRRDSLSGRLTTLPTTRNRDLNAVETNDLEICRERDAPDARIHRNSTIASQDAIISRHYFTFRCKRTIFPRISIACDKE